ncbi:MAG: DISARM system helicase DrmA [Nitrosopumilus sp.]|nr:DISARM system helicase DrmA [Nitrosopumilus sp.]
MREVLVADLVGNLLGPRGGHDEEIKGSPLAEYMTGVLSPAGAVNSEDESEIRESELDADGSNFIEDDAESGINVSGMLSPALNPQKIPSTMGLSFYVKPGASPEMDACVTWAVYSKAESGWKRIPKHVIFAISENEPRVKWVDSGGELIDKKDDAEISIHVTIHKKGTHPLVTVYMVNRIITKDERPTAPEHIFQPQIRIVCRDGTEIIPKPTDKASTSDEEKEFEMIYAGKKPLGRGHMTSVMWKEVDPEIPESTNELDPGSMQRPGFRWIDGERLPTNDREKFSKADIRTEFIPMHVILAPDVEWWPEGCEKPELSTKNYADCYDSAKLEKKLRPLASAYERWIADLKNNYMCKSDVGSEIIKKAEETCRRINGGIDYICDNGHARLAFCFACRAMYQQSEWKTGKDFLLRPFQLGFVMMSVESALNTKSPDRAICDLLWVPTGTGKTEAYLLLVAMVAAYRRLAALETGESGEGVAVISRYTLRLLTIQQFRRTLSLFTAMEYLRIDSLEKRKGVGWRPDDFDGVQNFLWGTAQFSAGLWVGRDVTPNSLEGEEGAIPALSDSSRGENAEPAQVLDCPACGSILALPQTGGPKGTVSIHHIIRVKKGSEQLTDLWSQTELQSSITYIAIKEIAPVHNKEQFFTLNITLEAKDSLTRQKLDELCMHIRTYAHNKGIEFSYISPRTKPGYFFKRYDGKDKPYDFEIFCTNDKCPLHCQWASGSPFGNINHDRPDPNKLTRKLDRMDSPDDNVFVDINPVFEIEPNVSDRIPIPAFTVDEQVYARLPTMIVSTVDKFAIMPFVPQSGQLFGNVDHYHCIRGYYRLDKHPSPTGNPNNWQKVRKLDPPSLIIQDELHLLDGPLGSRVGIYETAIDHLSTKSGEPVKYIASTATIRRASDHVTALFSREVSIFPPKGLSTDDRFFVKVKKPHLNDGDSGRLYLGVCAPGRSPLTPLAHIWSGLAYSLYSNRKDPNIDDYWAITGYFNAVRELAGARALYRQEIREWFDHLDDKKIFENDVLDDAKSIELSSRTPSTDLPTCLKQLDDVNSTDGPDALFTTSMFGTGVDVSRINTMIVNGQPKTSASYIQATGRVGRSRGALVVVFYRANRPRDLNHYEFFLGHHMQLHRFVEPPTVYPFAPGAIEHVLGPIVVSILRNKKKYNQWAKKDAAVLMSDKSNSEEIKMIQKLVENRARGQPESKQPDQDDLIRLIKNCIALWSEAARKHSDLLYNEYTDTEHPIVLGDYAHAKANKSPVYDNVPLSMRSVEEEAKFKI